jgi:hypothetical protein
MLFQMIHRLLRQVALLICGAHAIACASEQPDMPVDPRVAPARDATSTQPSTPDQVAAMPITTPLNLPFDFDESCRGSVKDVADGIATINVTRRSVDGGVDHRLGKGSLLAACGKLYRILAVGPGDSITYEGKPVAPPAGVAFLPDSLTIPVGGKADVDDLYLDGVTIVAAGGTVSAKLRVGIRQGSGPMATITYADSELRAGDTISVRDKRYRVLSTVPPDPTAGIPGWLEVDTKPVP